MLLTPKEKAQNRLSNELAKIQVGGKLRVKPKQTKPEIEQLIVELVAAIQNLSINNEVNLPELQQVAPNVAVSVPETVVQPRFEVNVPPAPKPSVIVNVPEQKMPAAPQVVFKPNIEVKPAEINYPEQILAKKWFFVINRDDRGLIANITAERLE